MIFEPMVGMIVQNIDSDSGVCLGVKHGQITMITKVSNDKCHFWVNNKSVGYAGCLPQFWKLISYPTKLAKILYE